ncbi:MAG: hypothetical protein LAP61_25790 [Acidobacteriia bacterium]|nr:hypothetical protein [Terriglobia bacterium]
MNNRREFLAAGAGLAALSAVPEATASEQKAEVIYLHGMVWSQQLPAPMNDWLLQFDAKVQIPLGMTPATTASPGFATFGDTIHTGAGAHVQLQSAILNGDHLIVTGAINEANNASLVGQLVRIEGKIEGTAVENLTITVGASQFAGSGLLHIAIIAILIGL